MSNKKSGRAGSDGQRKLIEALEAARIKLDDPSKPPLPLLQESGDTSFMMSYREGERVVMRGRQRYTPSALFFAAVVGSAGLQGQPVRCTGFVSGITLRVTVTRLSALNKNDGEDVLAQFWADLKPSFQEWLTQKPTSPLLDVHVHEIGMSAQFARDGLKMLPPGVMELEVID